MIASDPIGQGVQAHYVKIDEAMIEVRTAKCIANLCDYSHRHIQRLCDEGELIAYKSEGMYWIPTTEIRKMTLKRLTF